MTLQTDLEAAVAKVMADSTALHSIVHGPASGTGSTVTTDGGTVKTVAKAIADLEAEYAATGVVAAVDADRAAAEAARSGAEAAETNAEAAKDAAETAAANAASAGNVKVSASDSLAGKLAAKLLAGAGISLTAGNSGSNETLTVACTISPQDQVARDIAIAAYIKADVTANDNAGVYGRVWSDDFETDTIGVGRTGGLYDSANKWYTNRGTDSQVAQGTGSSIGDMSEAGGLAAAFDGNTAQDHATSTRRTFVSNNSAYCYVGKDWGAGNSRKIAYAKAWPRSDALWIGTGTGGYTVTLELRGSNDGSSWAVLGTVSVGNLGGSATPITATNTGTAYRYHAVFIKNNYSGNIEQYTSEVQFFEVGAVDNMTLISGATALAFEPNDVSAFFLVCDVDAVVNSTDRKIFASLDEGATWAEASTYTTVGSWGSTDKIIRADVNVAAQTGTSLKWKIATLNVKEQQIKQATGYAA